jgi:hypothetical protein
MMFCGGCGAQNLESSERCIGCGVSLQRALATAAPSSASTPVLPVGGSPEYQRLLVMYPHLIGVSGWLGLFVFTSLIGVPLVWAMTVRAPFGILQYSILASVGLGICAGLLTLKRHRYALPLLRCWLILRLALAAYAAQIAWVAGRGIDPKLGGSTMAIVAWLMYLSSSKRVKLTLCAPPS